MELKHFKLIHTIHEEGNLSKAAEKLYLTQSALSHQLKEIETEIGTLAFNRLNKRLVITDAGNILLDAAKKILHQVEEAEKEIRKQLDKDLGSIDIATECYTCYHWLPPILKKFNNRFPNVEVSINTENLKKPLELLLSGKIDIAVVHRLLNDKRIVYQDLFSDELVALLSNGHPLLQHQHLQASHFKDQHIITHARKFEEGFIFEKLLQPAVVNPARISYVHLTEAAIEMVKHGIGISIMAKWAIKPYLVDGKMQMRRITKKGLQRKWYVANLKNSSQEKYVSAFIELMQEGVN